MKNSQVRCGASAVQNLREQMVNVKHLGNPLHRMLLCKSRAELLQAHQVVEAVLITTH